MNELISPNHLPSSADVHHVNEWILETIDPWLKGRILELNSGLGSISSMLAKSGYSIQLNAHSESSRDFLKEKFKDEPLVRGIHKISLVNPSMELKYRKFQSQFSTVLAISEIPGQGSFDKLILAKAMRFLEPEGHLIAIGKSPIELFPGTKPDPGELKKYHRTAINSLMNTCSILKADYFDYDGLYYLAVGRKY